MKRMLMFVLLVCLLLPSTVLADWEISTENAGAKVSYTLDEPAAGSALAPAPGGGYYLGDGPTVVLPKELPAMVEAAPAATPTPVIPIEGDYTKGSVYGPRLTEKELAKVRSAVQEIIADHIQPGMNDKEKLIALVDALCDASSYAESYKGNANNAYGALVEGKAQCSGYARAFVALCDAVGIDCRYVHAAKNDPINPNHQWCLVEYGGKWYHIDPQMIDDYIRIVNGKVTHPRPITLMSSHLSYNEKGLPKTASKSITLR